MLFAYFRLWRILNLAEHLAIFVTTFVSPVAFELWDGWTTTGLCLPCVEWGRFVLYISMYQVALVVIVLSKKVDRAGVEQRIDSAFSQLDNDINQLREDHQREIKGNQDRVRDLQDWVTALRESIEKQSEFKLPGPNVRIRGTIRAGVPTVSVGGLTVIDSPGSIVRLRLWVRRKARWSWRWVRKWVVDTNYD